MKRLFLFLVICLFASTAAHAQVIGLYADEERTSYCVDGTGFFEFWLYALPGEDGMDEVWLSTTIEDPSGAFIMNAFYNDLIELTMGTVPGDLAARFHECQNDWTWICHATLFAIDADPNRIMIGGGFDNPYPLIVDCEGQDVPASPMTAYIINDDCVLETQLYDVEVVSFSFIRARFNLEVVEADAENVDNYRLFLTDSPADTIEITAAELEADGRTVLLSLESPAAPFVSYTLRASDIDNLYGGTCTSTEAEFMIRADICVTSLEASPDQIYGCGTTVEGSFKVKNTSIVGVGAFDVDLRFLVNNGASYPDNFDQVPIETYSYTSLAAGDSIVQEFSTEVPASIAWDYNYIEVVADEDALLDDLDISNNSMRTVLMNYTPHIEEIVDVYNDAGGWVEITFVGSRADDPGLPEPASEYEIYRRIDELPYLQSGDEGSSLERHAIDGKERSEPGIDGSKRLPLSGEDWELVLQVPAQGHDIYSVEVPTAADSTVDYGNHWSVYYIRAVHPLTGGTEYYSSCPDSGFSLDNHDYPADLVVTDVYSEPADVRNGCDELEIFFSCSNEGQFDAHGCVSIDLYFLISDGTSNTEDYTRSHIQGFVFDLLEADSTFEGSYNVHLPSSIAYDANYIEVVIDEDNLVIETDDENNTMRYCLDTYIPRILEIADVIGDYGGWVTIDFLASSEDDGGNKPVTSYEIMRFDMTQGWEVVETVAATAQPSYSLDAPTIADLEQCFFYIRAVHPLGSSTEYYASCMDIGISECDGPIAALLQGYDVKNVELGIELTWRLAEMDDELEFVVLRKGSNENGFIVLNSIEVLSEDDEFRAVDRDIEPGESYVYRVDYTVDGETVLLFETDAVQTPALPLTLDQNVPNPFNPTTEISYYLPVAAEVLLEVYDVTGKRVSTLVRGREEKGRRTVSWLGTDDYGRGVASGIYFYRLRAGKEVISKKMVLLR